MMGPPPGNSQPVKFVDPLAKRLSEYPSKRWKLNEAFSIINDFLMKPYLAPMIETMNKVHRVKVCTDDNNYTHALKFQWEKDKKPGFWNWLKRLFAPYETCIKISSNGQLFLCEYYKHSFFEMSDKMKIDYDAKLKPTFGSDFVVICRAK